MPLQHYLFSFSLTWCIKITKTKISKNNKKNDKHMIAKNLTCIKIKTEIQNINKDCNSIN